jgi:hypothetical protein
MKNVRLTTKDKSLSIEVLSQPSPRVRLSSRLNEVQLTVAGTQDDVDELIALLKRARNLLARTR